MGFGESDSESDVGGPYRSPTIIEPEITDGSERLSFVEKVGYGLGDTASNLYWKTFEFLLVYFYTDVFGISAAAAGTMLLVTKVWDAVNDPLMGYIVDRTHTSWGKFRPYLVWMAIPFAIAGILTFYTPDLDTNGKLIYAYVTYTLVMMAYTAINIPYGALMGVISPNSIERTSVSTYRFVLAFVGGIIVQFFALKLVAFFGGTETIIVDGVEKTTVINEQAGFFWTMVLFSIAAVLLFLVTFATTRERVAPDETQKPNFRRDLKNLFTNRPWMVLAVFGLFQLIAAFVRGGAILYYFKYFVGDQSYTPAFWLSGSFAAIAGMFLTRPLAEILGKKMLMIYMNLGTALATAAFFMIGPSQISLMFILYIVGAFISGPSPVLLWAMYADVADYSEWKNHRRATGLIFSAATFSQKLGCAVGAAMTGWVLNWYAYQPPVDGTEVAQTEFTLGGIQMMMSLIPAVFLVLAAMSLAFYNINESLLKQLEADLRERKNNQEN